jgi:hypothetical protein
MKEIKDFFEEIEKLEIAQGVIDINEAKRLVSEAYVAGINFQAKLNKEVRNESGCYVTNASRTMFMR